MPRQALRSPIQLRRLLAAALLGVGLCAPAAAQQHGPGFGDPRPPRDRGHFPDQRGGWARHPGWQGDIRRFDHGYWRSGHWWQGEYGGRLGWWWIVGPNWYLYPQPLYPYPDPYAPPGASAGFWYWCDAYRQYYPYVGACPSGWRAVPPR